MAAQLQELLMPLRLSAAEMLPSTGQGKQIVRQGFCIADIDTRSYDHSGQLLSPDFNAEKADAHSSGMLNHFMYASVHGYHYHLIKSHPWPANDRDDVWSRLITLLALLDICPSVLVLDSDVVFQQLELPFDHLLDRWNITTDTPLAIPWDTSTFISALDPHGRQTANNDKKGLRNLNGGVMIVQDLPRTRELLEAWIRCPDDTPGCGRYRSGWPAEQGALNNYIRYMFPEDIKTIPCDDANGFPEQPSDCHGRYLRHFTTEKDRVTDNVAHVMFDQVARTFAAQRASGRDG